MGRLRTLRGDVLNALSHADLAEARTLLEAHPPKPLLGPLYACLLDTAPLVRWRAVEAFGWTVARLAKQRREAARECMRQIMWRLNEESGNIAWGVPEAFGSILASELGLAMEFHRVLCSYIDERDSETGDNYLELPMLRRGVYWGLARLASATPAMVLPAVQDLLKALSDEDPHSRALAALALGLVLALAGERADAVRQGLAGLAADHTPVELYMAGELRDMTVAQAAALALEGATV
ncbi:HEAT repeat domain-containing protein [Fundidesulfovibrio butyratiphilus]